MKRWGSLALLLLVALVLGPSVLLAERPVRVGIYENEPLVFTSAQGKPQGFYVDLLEHVAQQEGWQVEYVWCQWPDCLARLEQGDLDLMTAIAYSEAREARFDFTRETVLANWGQVYAHPGAGIESVLDLDGRRLAAVPDDIYTRGLSDILARFGVSCQVLPAADYGEVLHLVEAGQADAGIVARFYGDQHGAKYDVDRTPILCCPVELRFAAPKGRSADLLAALDRHLAALKADPGSLYFRSLDRWLGGPRSAGLPDWVPRALALGGAAVVLLAGGTLYFRWQMRARTRHLQAEIARREQVEEGLRRARHEWEEIFQAIGHPTLILDPEHRILAANRAAAQATGQPEQALLGALCYHVFHGTAEPPAGCPLERMRVSGVLETEAMEMEALGGTYLVSCTPVWDEEGHLQRVIHIATDITARKKAEEALQKRERELDVLSRLGYALAQTLDLPRIYRTAYDHVREAVDCPVFGISRYDPESRTLQAEYMLEDGQELDVSQLPPLGMDVEPTRGRAKAIATGQPEVVRDLVAAAQADGQAVYLGVGSEERIARSAAYVPMVVQGQVTGLLEVQSYRADAYTEEDIALLIPVANLIGLAIENGRLFAEVQGYTRELEERVRARTAELEEQVAEADRLNRALTNLLEDLQAANRRLAATTHRLEEANQELEAFAYSVSHDLRAPLRAVEGFAQALLEDYTANLDPTAQDFAQRIVAAAQRMNALIDDLLAYSRLSRQEMRLSPVPLDRVVETVLEGLAPEIQEREAQVTVEGPLPAVEGHETTLVQVVTNLVDNALKFVAPGTRPQVRLWAEERDEGVRLWVEDNGIGIAPEHHERIFHIFERLHGWDAFPGTGVGLAIVRRGVERMGGRAGVESEVGKGSRFWVELKKAEATGPSP